MISESIRRALVKISTVLQPAEGKWLVGGSCGLLLHQIPIGKEPRDLDLYIDKRTSPDIYPLLAPFATDQPQYSETDIYRSHLSHYDIGGIAVELVGGFQVLVEGATYQVRVNQSLNNFSKHYSLQGHQVYITPLAHELIFNVLRNRPDRYELISEVMKANPELHLPAMLHIVQSNFFNMQFLQKFSELLNYSFV